MAAQDKRLDIQGLRALAVAGVVLFHFGFGLPGGFIGVDVFFVISGFVIGQILLNELSKTGQIDFRNFLANRFFRLMPALGLVTLVTMLFSALIFTSRSLHDTTALTVASSLAGISNFVIAYVSGGYFGQAAEENPLLHTWSLSVEWQFYLLIPILFLFFQSARKRQFFPGLIIGATFLFIGLVSFLFNFLDLPDVIDGRIDINGFYSSIGRIWEFCAGALTALVVRKTILRPISATVISGLGLFAVLFSFALFEGGMQTPGRSTLVPILGTMAMIVGGSSKNSVTNKLMSARPLALIGDLSYSIYLWHWPLIFFWKKFGLTDLPLGNLVLVFATVVLSWVTFRFVESPLRRRRTKLNRVRATTAIALFLAPMVLIGVWAIGGSQYHRYLLNEEIIKSIPGDIGHATFHRTVANEFVECRNQSIRSAALSWGGFLRCQQTSGNKPVEVAIIGDSHAEHLFYGLAKEYPNTEIVYYIRSELPAVSSSEEMAEIIRQVADTVSIRTVILTAFWIDRGLPANRLQETVQLFRSSGKQVVLTTDIPFARAISPEGCKTSRFIFDQQRLCIWEDGDREEVSQIRATLQGIADDTGSELVDTYEIFCREQYCSMAEPFSNRQGQQILMYRDKNHLNLLGSSFVAKRFQGILH